MFGQEKGNPIFFLPHQNLYGKMDVLCLCNKVFSPIGKTCAYNICHCGVFKTFMPGYSSLGAPGWQCSWSGGWKLSIECDQAVRGKRRWSCSVSIPRTRLTSFVRPCGRVECGTGTPIFQVTRRSGSSQITSWFHHYLKMN